MSLCTIRQAGKVISALQNSDQTSLTEGVGQFANLLGHPGKGLGGKVDLCQGIFTVGVKTGGDQNKIRLEFGHCGQYLNIESLPVFIISGPRHHWDIQSGTGSLAGSVFPLKAGTGKQRVWMLVDTDKKSMRIGLELVLCAVAVVNVPVQDRDPLDLMVDVEVFRGDGDIIEEAETHGGSVFGVMAGGAYRAESDFDLTSKDPIHGCDASAGSQAGYLKAIPADGAVGGIDGASAFFACSLEAVNVLPGVDPLDKGQIDTRRGNK